jgi:hypothetical protein
MRKTALAIVLSVALLGVGCGGGGGSGAGVNINAELQTCASDGTTFLFGLVATLSILQTAIESDTTDEHPDLSVTRVGESDAFDFVYSMDGDATGLAESTIAGRITFSADPIGGIKPGDTAAAQFAISGTEGFGGMGTFNATFQESEQLLVWGSGDLDLPGLCSMAYDVDENSPMSFGLRGPIPMAEFFGIPVAGVLKILAEYGTHSLDATTTFTADSNVVKATGVVIDGQDAEDFDAELAFNPEQLEILGFCLFGHAEVSFDMARDLFEIMEGNLNEATFTDGTLVVTDTANPLVSNFTLTWGIADGIFEVGDVVTGTVAFNEDPDTAAELSATLRFNFVPMNGLGRIYTSSPNPLVAFAADWGEKRAINVENAVISGSVICDFSNLGVVLAQEEEPVRCFGTTTFKDYQDNSSSSGTVSIRVSRDGGSLWALIQGNNEGDGSLYLNGIPLPIELFFGFFDV